MLFKNPITYLPETKKLYPATIKDLELETLYSGLFNEKLHKLSNVRENWIKNYTTNVEFLKDTQKLLESANISGNNTKKIEDLWRKYTENKGFRETYEYITFEKFRVLNKYESVLQAISMYTLISPVLSLISPFLMLLIPFFIIRIKGSAITLPKYIEVLKNVLGKTPIGQIFNLSSASWDQRIFIIFSILFYFVQMYQNSVTCYKFYRNSKEMYETLQKFSEFGKETIDKMNEFDTLITENGLSTYQPFIQDMREIREKLTNMCSHYENIKSGTFQQMGNKMKYFYEIYCDEEVHDTLKYAIDFNEYLRNLDALMANNELNKCKFSTKKLELREQFYAPLQNNKNDIEPVKNNLKLDKNAILSGPNASGKTTQLKGTLFNIILSQQIGKGFYKSAYIIPQHYFHCYINIPDTNDRDSLFQAEARKCKEILNILEKHPTDNHFCVFDELFSGTNPYEAVASATAYLDYLHQFKNVKYMLTTHYIDLCKNMNGSKSVNYTMGENYTLQMGISKIKGGIKVLEEQAFPIKIIERAKELVS